MRTIPSRVRESGDRGFSLVESIIAMTVFSVLGAAMFSTVMSSQSSAKATRRTNNLNEEARVALNRLSRELRQAREIVYVNPANPSALLEFDVDFNNNDVIEPSAPDAERLRYSYDPDKDQILLTTATPTGTSVTLPILASDVTSFTLDYRSRDYRYDRNGDGVTTWQELDPTPANGGVGDGSGTLTAAELKHIDSVVISFTVLKDRQAQVYRTQVDLRNRP